MSRYKALKFGCIGELRPLVGGKVVRDHCPNGIPHLAMAFYWRNRVGSLEQWAIGGWSGTARLRRAYPFAGEFQELRQVAFSKPIWVYGVSRDQGDASSSTSLNRI
jgi:hypothetical protein